MATPGQEKIAIRDVKSYTHLQVLRIVVAGVKDLPIQRRPRFWFCPCWRRKPMPVFVDCIEVDPKGSALELPARYQFATFDEQYRDGTVTNLDDNRFVEISLHKKIRIRFEVCQAERGAVEKDDQKGRTLARAVTAYAEIDVEDLKQKRYWELQLSDPGWYDTAVYGTDRARPPQAGEHKFAHWRRPSFLQIYCWVVRYGGLVKVDSSNLLEKIQSDEMEEIRNQTPQLHRHNTGASLGSHGTATPSTFPNSEAWKDKKNPNFRKRVMIYTRGTRGDVQPFAALARGLAQEPFNCEVVFVTEIIWRKFVHDVRRGLPKGSIRFRPSGGNTTARAKDNEWLLSKGAAYDALQALVLSASEAEFFSSEGLFFHWAHTMDPDFIVYGLTCQSLSMIISEALKIPIVGFIMQPAKGLELRANVNNVMDELFGPVREIIDAKGFNALVQQIMEKMPQGKNLNPYRRSRGLSRCPHDISMEDKHAMEIRKQEVPRIVPINEIVLSKQAQILQDEGFTLTDFIFLRLHSDTLSSELTDFLEHARSEGRKVVLLTFSSMPVGEQRILSIAADICKNCFPPVPEGETSIQPAFIAMCGGQGFEPPDETLAAEVEKLEKSNQLLVLRKGAPFGVLFPELDAILLHGGCGVISEAALAGKPTVTSGILLMDQRFWAARMEELGSGSAGIPVDDMSIEEDNGKTIGVTTMEKALDSRTDVETWSMRARTVKKQLEDSRGVDSDGVAMNAKAVYDAGTVNAKPVRDAYKEEARAHRCLLRQLFCIFVCGHLFVQWCLCSQIPGCWRLLARIGKKCFCCRPVRTFFSTTAQISSAKSRKVAAKIHSAKTNLRLQLSASTTVVEERADFGQVEEPMVMQEIVVEVKHSQTLAPEDAKRLSDQGGVQETI